MELEIDWFLIVILPFVLCTTWAALLLWRENLQQHFSRLLFYSVIASIIQTITYYQLHIELIRFLLEIASGYVLAWMIFRQSWRWTAKIFLTSYLFGIIFYSMAAAIIVVKFQVPFTDLLTKVDIAWLMITLPFNFLMVMCAWLIRRSYLPGLEFVYELKEKSWEHPSLIVALVIQGLIFTGLVAQIFLNDGSASLPANAVIFVGLFLLCGLSIYILLKYMQISRKEICYTQDTAAENIVEMLNTVRGQRHDFLNHLQVIHGLSRLHDYEALEEYLGDLVDDASRYGELLQIDNPIIASLVNAKMAQASSMGIKIEPTIRASLAPLAYNALDVGRILGNLVDNALEAVQETDAKWLGLDISEQGGWMHCAVTNPSCCTPEQLQDIFAPGVSSKPDHSGLGLFIARKLAHKLQGRIEVACAANRDLTFTLIIPVPAAKNQG